MGSKEEELTPVEDTFAYHSVCHSHSFRYLDCTSKLLQLISESKFTYAQIKAGAIVLNVFIPCALQRLHADLEKCSFFLTDASNHKEKIFSNTC